MKSPRAVSGQSVDRESAERRSCPPSGGVVRRAAELSAEWRSCPPRRSCPPAELSASGPFRRTLFGGPVRLGPRRVRSKSNGVHGFPADPQQTRRSPPRRTRRRTPLGSNGVRLSLLGVQWSLLGQKSALDIAD